MAMEAENSVLPSKGLSDNHRGVIKDEFQVLRHVTPTTQMYRKNSSRLRISKDSALSVDAEKSLGVSPLGSAGRGPLRASTAGNQGRIKVES